MSALYIERGNFQAGYLASNTDIQNQVVRGPEDLDPGWLVDPAASSSNHVFVMGPVRASYVGQVAGPPIGNSYTGAFAVDIYFRPQRAFSSGAFPFQNHAELLTSQAYFRNRIATYANTRAKLTPLIVPTLYTMTAYYVDEVELPKIIQADTLAVIRVWVGMKWHEIIP